MERRLTSHAASALLLEMRPKESVLASVVAIDRLGIRVRCVWLSAIVLAMSIACGRAGHASYSQGSLTLEPEFSPERFKSETFIRLAIQLQALGREKAELRLHEIARNEYTPGMAIILSRMLFKKRPGEQFTRPSIGGALFMGGTDYSDWPLEPIELVDDVPFVISRGYFIAGRPENDDEYVRYCETHADWSDLQYEVPTKQQEQAALAKLVTSPKWKVPLTDKERELLSRQIE
jgi:hypothetical protein